MVTISHNGITLSASATLNADVLAPIMLDALRSRRDFARREEGRQRRNERRARIADKRHFLAN